MTDHSRVSVRYLVDDVAGALSFYTDLLGFEQGVVHLPAFAEVTRGPLRLLLSGPASSGTRATPSSHAGPGANRVHLVVDDLEAEVRRLRETGVPLRSDIVSGPGGRQVLLSDPAGNLVELFTPAEG